MKLPSLILFGSLFSSHTSAHYVFGRLIFNNTWTQDWEYVRNVSSLEPDFPEPPLDPTAPFVPPNHLLYPLKDVTSPDLACGRNASQAWNKPKTATLHAGDKVGFAPGATVWFSGSTPDSDTPRIYHHGIASMWLSKAPSEVLNAYRGDGAWFKIFSMLGREAQSLDFELPENKIWYDKLYSQFGNHMLESVNATIPKTTPPGRYLLRFEHIYPNEEASNGAQFYVNCAHVEILNDGAVGTPGPLVRIPGVYKPNQTDVNVNTYAWDFKIANMKAPAPEVWKG